nr:MAG TPA: hypothetical protein [Caudoviricetes sp.]
MKKILQNKIDFCVIISVDGANPNGDPLNDNRPRITYEGYGEISDVCIKRKIRNRLQDMGENIFVQSSEKCNDGCKSLTERAMAFEPFKNEYKKKLSDADVIRKVTSENWIDVRAFGQVFPFKGLGVTTNVRGCVSIGAARSLNEINVETVKITKSVNLDTTEDDRKDKTTIAEKHIVNKAAYVFYGSIFPQLAQINNFTEKDTEKIHHALKTLFYGDESAARPSGTMNVQQVYWWKHDCPNGQYPPIKVFKTLDIKPEDEYPYYSIIETPLPDLKAEIFIL